MTRREELRAERDWVDRIEERNARARRIADLQDPERHGDRPRDDLGVMRVIIWGSIIVALLIVTATAMISRAHAADGHFVIHGLSLHGKTTRDDGVRYNQRNPGIALRLELSPIWSVQAGRYENSLSEPEHPHHSRYIGVDYTRWIAVGGRMGAYGGAVDGYPWRPWGCGPQDTNRNACNGSHQWHPAAGLIARWQVDRLSAVLRASPTKHSNGVIALEIGIRL
jgi:hypothetical protein